VSYGNRRPRVHPSSFVDPGSRIAGDVEIGPDCAILFGSAVRGDDEPVRILERSVVLEHALIEAPEGHPVTIGPGALVSHGAIVHGARVERGALVGIGAIVLDGATVGEYSIVAAGAVVPPGREVESGWLVAGVPARPLRRVTEEESSRTAAEIERVLSKVREYRRVLTREG